MPVEESALSRPVPASLLPKAQDHTTTQNDTVVLPKGSMATTRKSSRSITNNSVKPRDPRVSSIRRVSFNLTSTVATPRPDPQSQTPMTSGRQKHSQCTGEAKSQPRPGGECSERRVPLRLCIKHKNWAISPNSHPLSQRRCSTATSLLRNGTSPKMELKRCDVWIHAKAEDSVAESDDKSARESSTTASHSDRLDCLNKPFVSLSSNQLQPTLAARSNVMDKITKSYCTVDLDTDFIANFNFDFLNDNII